LEILAGNLNSRTINITGENLQFNISSNRLLRLLFNLFKSGTLKINKLLKSKTAI